MLVFLRYQVIFDITNPFQWLGPILVLERILKQLTTVGTAFFSIGLKIPSVLIWSLEFFGGD